MRTRAGSKPLDPRSFNSVLEALVEDLKRRWYSQASEDHVRILLPRFFAFLETQRIGDLRQVTEDHVTTYARQLAGTRTARGTPFSVAYQRHHLQSVQQLFRFLEREGALLRDPTLDLVLPHWKRLPRALLNQAQARKLVAQPDPSTSRGKRDRAILELLYGAAIRVSECERLDVRDLDLGRGQLFIRDGKGRKDRVVPVVGQAAHALDVYLQQARSLLVRDPREGALFLTRRGYRLPIKRIQDLVRSHAKAAGLSIRVTPHTLRHGCATHLLQGGADIRHVQKLLGHAHAETTALYAQVAPRDLARAVERAHPRERTWRRRRARETQ